MPPKKGGKVLKTHQKKVRKFGEERGPKKFVHKKFAQQVSKMFFSQFCLNYENENIIFGFKLNLLLLLFN